MDLLPRESLCVGGTLAKYASEGVQTCVLTATRGERGRRGEMRDCSPDELGALREAELVAACRELASPGPLALLHGRRA
jgi:LmbE family N-acetylglucosaminyl deacetylase